MTVWVRNFPWVTIFGKFYFQSLKTEGNPQVQKNLGRNSQAYIGTFCQQLQRNRTLRSDPRQMSPTYTVNALYFYLIQLIVSPSLMYLILILK